jgi:L-histidine Nalpha-methyltransferase
VAQRDASERDLTRSTVERPARADPTFLRDVVRGLGRARKAIPSRWLYDTRGSELFREIMALDAYYPTRVEEEILDHHAARIAARLPDGSCTLVDLGAGDGAKTGRLVAALGDRGPLPTYAPVDISPVALAQACGRMASAFPGLRLAPMRAEYSDALRALDARRDGAMLVLFLGSNVGNLEWDEAVGLLRSLRRALLPGDHALVGFDLLKEAAVLEAAYDDAEGVTAAFNLNLLDRLNRELGGDLERGAFEHVATFDPARPAMESWLRSRRRQRFRVGGRCFSLEAGERIHTEISWKYRADDLATLARCSGFVEVGRFSDGRGRFVDGLWRAGAP